VESLLELGSSVIIADVTLRKRFGVTGAKPYRIVAHGSRQPSTLIPEVMYHRSEESLIGISVLRSSIMYI
jgi:hypothetical protein